LDVLRRLCLGCGLLLACDPLVDGIADSPDPSPRREARSLYSSCLRESLRKERPACLVLDDFRTLVMFAPDGSDRCEVDILLPREARTRLAWIGDDLFLCSREGLERVDLNTGTSTVVGDRCQGALELDEQLIVFETPTRVRLQLDRSADASEAFDLTVPPWPGLSTGWRGEVQLAREPKPQELISIQLDTGERSVMSLPERLSLAGGIERLDDRRIVALEHRGPGDARWIGISIGATITTTESPTRSRLFDPQLIDCRLPRAQ
jgi:hypothetical protein